MNAKGQIFAAWCGPIYMVLLLLGWVWIGGYFPPVSPAAAASELAAFNHNPLPLRFGLWIGIWATVFYIIYSAELSIQMARIEKRAPLWSYTQLAAGAGTTLTLSFPMVFWAVAAFRPERGADLILLLSDLAWIPFAGMTSPFILQPICIAMAGFMDKSEHPTFPRWACFYQLFVASLMIPTGVIIFFKTGPFAWTGLFGLWIPVFNFGIWFIVTTYLLIKSIKRQDQEERLSEAVA